MVKFLTPMFACLMSSSAFAVTAWVTPTDAPNSNANWPAVNGTYSQNFGIAFKTGLSGPFGIDWITLNLNTSNVTAGSSSLKIALRNTTDSTAYSAVAGTTEYAMDIVNFTMPTTTATMFDLELDFSDLPNISSYSMQSDTSYALILYAPGNNIGMGRITGYLNGTTNDQYTTSDGFAVLDTFRNNSPNYQNSASSFPSLGISFGETSAVPEPGQLGGLAAFLAGSLFLRTRRRSRFDIAD